MVLREGLLIFLRRPKIHLSFFKWEAGWNVWLAGRWWLGWEEAWATTVDRRRRRKETKEGMIGKTFLQEGEEEAAML